MTAKRLKKVTENIISSVMSKEVAVQHFDSSPLPDKECISKVVTDIFVILFPGYFDHSDMSFDSIEMRLSYRIARVYEFLKPQIYRELIHECCNVDAPCGICDEAAEFLVLDFLDYVPELRKKLELDVKAAYRNDPAAGSFDEIIFSYPGLEAITVHRAANYFYGRGLRLIPRIMSEWAHSRTGIDIHPGATIGEGFFIDHGTGVVVGETTIIGNNVTLYQGVTIGALNFPRDSKGEIIKSSKRHPTIGDSVVIYAGATILGGETNIGSNSVIGGNVWLTESVAEGSKVIIADCDLRILNKQPCVIKMQK